METARARIGDVDIREGGLDDSRVIALIEAHAKVNRSVSQPESCHVLSHAQLRGADVIFWSAWDGDTLLGVGALKRLDAAHGEVKSMHTSEAARRRGVGGAILDTIIARARADGLQRLSLETGSMDYFAPARALYRRRGFTECAPFGAYIVDPLSVFMKLDLR